jgi:osmoprotectant transport system substrate-binding protein
MPMSRRPRLIAAVIAVLAIVSLAAACGDDDDSASSTDSSLPEVKIATQDFGENKILGQIYGQVLAAKGFKVSYQSFKDRAAIYAAIDSGDANFYPEYAASGVEFLNGNKGEATSDPTATVAALQKQLDSRDLTALEPAEAIDTNSLVVTKDTADSKNLTAISQLDNSFRLGGPQDCPTNAGCIPGLQKTYGLDLSANFQPLDLSGPNTKAALKNGDIDVAVIFSTDSSIAENGWVVLEDDKGLFAADVVVPIVTNALAENSELTTTVNETSKAITTEELTKLNKRFDVDKEDADTIAADFIEAEDLK